MTITTNFHPADLRIGVEFVKGMRFTDATGRTSFGAICRIPSDRDLYQEYCQRLGLAWRWYRQLNIQLLAVSVQLTFYTGEIQEQKEKNRREIK